MDANARKVEYVNKQNKIVPHWDEAKNIAYDRTGVTNLSGQANDVQTAITELAGKIGSGNGNTVVSSGAYVKLEDFPGYEEEFGAPITNYVDIRTTHVIYDYIYGVYPIDTDFATMEIVSLPENWSEGDEITWNENNPRNWYIGAHHGHDAKPASGKARSCRKYIDCIRDGYEDKWFVTYKAAETALNNLDVEEGTYGIFVSSRMLDIYSGNFDRYENPILIDPEDLSAAGLTQAILNSTAEERVIAFQEDFLAQNANLMDRAKRTREFLQEVFNETGPDDIVLFPHNKTFIINFYPKVHQYGEGTNPGYDYYAEENKYKQYDNSFYLYCLFIYHKMNINLNESTIKLVPHWQRGYGMITIQNENILDLNPISTFDDIPCGGYITNGTIEGEWAEHMWLPVRAELDTSTHNYSQSAEHCSGISAKDVMSLINLRVHNFSGDGISFDSPKEHLNPIIFSHSGKLSETGSLGSITTNQAGYWYSDELLITSYHTHPDRAAIVRPKYATEAIENKYYSNSELAPYFIDEEFAVAYYNSAHICISVERPCFHDVLQIPNSATYFRFFIHIDPTIEAYNSSLGNEPGRINLVLYDVNWKEHSVIEGCEIYNCGRNGITPTAMPKGYIRNCNLYNEDTGEQASIDIEGVSGLDTGITAEDLWLHSSRASIKSVTGDAFHIVRCKCKTIETAQPHLNIEDCDVQFVKGRVKYFNNIVKPRRVIKGTHIRQSLSISYGLVSNCRIRGIIDISQSYDDESKYPTVYENCVLRVSKLGPGIYNNCNIIIDESLSTNAQYVGFDTYGYKGSHYIEANRYIFDNCRISANNLHGIPGTVKQDGVTIKALLNFKNCKISLAEGYSNGSFEDSKSQFNYVFIESFVGNIVSASAESTYPLYKFIPYGNCVISGNTFKVNNLVTNFKAIRVRLYKTTVLKSYNVSIRDNVIEYSGTSSNLGIDICEGNASESKVDGNVIINIKNNTFVKNDDNTVEEDITSYNLQAPSNISYTITVNDEDNSAVNGGTLTE